MRCAGELRVALDELLLHAPAPSAIREALRLRRATPVPQCCGRRRCPATAARRPRRGAAAAPYVSARGAVRVRAGRLPYRAGAALRAAGKQTVELGRLLAQLHGAHARGEGTLARCYAAAAPDGPDACSRWQRPPSSYPCARTRTRSAPAAPAAHRARSHLSCSFCFMPLISCAGTHARTRRAESRACTWRGRWHLQQLLVLAPQLPGLRGGALEDLALLLNLWRLHCAASGPHAVSISTPLRPDTVRRSGCGHVAMQRAGAGWGEAGHGAVVAQGALTFDFLLDLVDEALELVRLGLLRA